MNRILYATLFVIFGLFMWTSVVPAQASPNQPETVIYFPMISRGPLLMNEAVTTIEAAAKGSDSSFHTPMDAAPDPTGATIYFTAMSAQGAGVFSVPATGGAVVTLTVGTPLTVPIGIAVSTNGQTIYVADSSAMISPTQASTIQAISSKLPMTGTGAIFSLPSVGGVPTPITATIHTAPRGLTVVKENNVDVIYFTGFALDDGRPAVMKVPANGGALTVVEKDTLLVEPVGIAVSKSGLIYTADPATGKIIRFPPQPQTARNDHRDIIAENITFGSPAGITLTFDESLLLVSSLDGGARTSQVLVINTQTLDQGIVNKAIGVNTASGGLHRAHNNNIMAWCGPKAGIGGQGIVYLVSP